MSTQLTRLIHPYSGGGWRWAIHLAHPDELDVDPVAGILNAGHEFDERECERDADLVFMAVWRAFHLTGRQVKAFRATWPEDRVTGTEHDRVLVLADE